MSNNTSDILLTILYNDYSTEHRYVSVYADNVQKIAMLQKVPKNR